MKEATLTAEYIIIGFLCLLNFVFLGLLTFHVYDINKILAQFNNNKEFIIVAVLAISYYLGGLTHRLSTIWDKPKYHKIVQKYFKFLTYTLPPENDDKYYKRQFVYQFGSEYVAQLIEKEDKFMMLFKSVAVLLTPFSFILSLWIYSLKHEIKFSFFLFACLITIVYLSIQAHKRQRKIYWDTILRCYDTLHNNGSVQNKEI